LSAKAKRLQLFTRSSDVGSDVGSGVGSNVGSSEGEAGDALVYGHEVIFRGKAAEEG